MIQSQIKDLVIEKKISNSVGRSTIFLSRNSNNKKYIIKKTPKKINDSDREKKALQLIDNKCPSIVYCHEITETNNSIYFLFDYHQYGDLFTCINNNHNWILNNLDKICKDMVESVKFLHTIGICHLDIKPENYLISNYIIKLCDMGSAEEYSTRNITLEHAVGTTLYMSPEIYNYHAYNDKSDVYSLGVTMYVLKNAIFPYDVSNIFSTDNIIFDENNNYDCVTQTAMTYNYEERPNIFDFYDTLNKNEF